MSVLLVGRSPIDIAFAVALGSGVALLVGIVWVTVGAPLTVSPPRDLGDPVLVGAVVLVAAAVGAGDGGLFPAVLAAVLPSAAVFATPALAERGPPIAHVAVEAVWYGALVAVPFAPIGYVLGIGVATVRRRIRPGTPAP